ncbi:PorP/SprF family type IX secretion system membrane protein [Chryseolinea sp. T2]|uniref:PorP/SprF family type IX secretion system membrane protein n=1 Tax=Chryseolinea sp. T2 TaxID=3129255 RepID=UPI003077F833
MAKTLGLLYSFDRRTVVHLLLIIVLEVTSTQARAQYFQFSQFNFTPQRINPALVATSNYAQVAFVYRNQGTDGGFRLASNSLNAMYPIQSRTGNRWSGVGVSFLDDRSGQAGIFSTQEAGLSYAINIAVASRQSLSLGAKVLYQGRRINLDGLYTGSQYIPDRGFDESVSPGENFGELKSDYVTFSMGLHWQIEDKDETVAGYWDISFFDLNRPEEAFITAWPLNPTMVAGGGLRVYQRRQLSIFPQVLYTRCASNNVVNAGAVFRYDLIKSNKGSPYLDLRSGFVFGRSAVLGLQYQNDRIALGVSYDFPFFYNNVANTGAIEVGIVLKKEIARKKKQKANSKQASVAQKPKKLSAPVGVKKPPVVVRDSSAVRKDSLHTATMSERLRLKQDSLAAMGMAGQLKHEPLILEKATLRFGFEFNSAEPSAEAREYLDQLATALKDNHDLHLQLVGHTDNIGSDKFNIRLSLARAQAFRDYLVNAGVESARIVVDGKGMSEPLNDNATPDKQALNRRVEMTIVYNK